MFVIEHANYKRSTVAKTKLILSIKGNTWNKKNKKKDEAFRGYSYPIFKEKLHPFTILKKNITM